MRAAWSDTAVEESNLSVQIAALRKQLGPTPDGGDWIVTIPRVGYRFVGSGAEQPHTDGARRRGPSASIAIDRMLPFANIGGEKEQEYLADGITEDIITALTRFRWFFVIARNSSFAYKDKSIDVKQVAQELGVQYLLEGSLRRSGQRVRISAQLVDATSGKQIWAERYDLELTEVFAIQDEIAERVAGAIEPELLKTEGAQAAARHTGNMTAWDLVRRGTWHFHQVTRENHLRARELFREACKLNSDLPRRTSGSPGSVPEWFPMAGRRSPLLSCKRGCRPRSRLSISMSAILTRIMLLRSSASSQDNSNRRSERRARRSKSVQALRLGIWVWEWPFSSVDAHQRRSPHWSMGCGSALTIHKTSYGSICSPWLVFLPEGQKMGLRLQSEPCRFGRTGGPLWKFSPAVMPNLIDGTKRAAAPAIWQVEKQPGDVLAVKGEETQLDGANERCSAKSERVAARRAGS